MKWFGARARLPALALAALAAAGCNQLEVRSEPRPDVLLVTVDTLRADHVGAWGARDAHTPNLDRLAREGARFETAIAPTPLTLPSHATLLTGRLPPAHGVRHNGLYRLDASVPTLAEQLQAAGWQTAAVVGALVLDRGFGLARGFADYDDAIDGRRAAAGGAPERRADAVSDAAIARIQAAEGPLFLWLHYYDPHARYQAPAPFGERFADDPYAGEIAWVDAQLGRVLDALEASGRLERTLVAVTSDHGESLGEHGERTHGYTLFDASLHVPLLLRGPGVPAAAVVPGVVSLDAVAPTLLSLLGLPALAGASGEDLSARLHGAPKPQATHAYAESLASRLDHGMSPVHAVRGERFHYVRSPRPELYDLASDPRAERNLLTDGAPETLREQAQRLDAQVAAALEGARESAPAALDPALRAGLEALGYAMGDAPGVSEGGLDYKDGLAFIEPYVEARAAHLAGDGKRAERLLAPLFEALPQSARVRELGARIAAKRGDVATALGRAEQAARLAPDSPATWLLLGDLHHVQGDRDAAAAAWREALARNPRDPGAQLRLAEWHEQRREYEPALVAYRAAAALDPELEAAQLGAAIQLLRLGREAEAERVLAELGDPSRDPVLANRLAVAWIGAGRPERAEALWEALLETHPDHRAARHNLARLRGAAPDAAPR